MLSQKMRNFLKRIFAFVFFFVRIFVFEIWSICIQQWLAVNRDCEKLMYEMFPNLIQTLTSEARVSI